MAAWKTAIYIYIPLFTGLWQRGKQLSTYTYLCLQVCGSVENSYLHIHTFVYRAVASILTTLLWPVVPFCLQLGVVAAWLFISLYPSPVDLWDMQAAVLTSHSAVTSPSSLSHYLMKWQYLELSISDTYHFNLFIMLC